MTTTTHARGPDATTTAGGLRPLLRLMANQPVRYPISLAVWTLNWTWPVMIGVIAQQYFDGLDGTSADQAGWTLVTVVIALGAYLLVRLAGIFFGMWWHARLLFRAGAGMQRSMLRRIFALPGARPVRESPGEVVSRFRDDVEHTTEALDLSVDFTGSIVSATVSFVLLARIDPVLAMVAFAPMVVVLLVVWTLANRIRRYRESARETTEAVAGFLGETLSATQSIKVNGAERPVLDRFARLNDRRRVMMVRDRTLTAATDAMGQTTGTVGTGLVLLLAAGSLARGGAAGLSVGDFALFGILLAHTSFAAFFIGTFLARIRQAGVSFDRMVDLMDGSTWRDLTVHSELEESLPVPTAPATRVGVVDRVDAPLLAVRGLTHVHPDAAGGIHDVDLQVERGQLVVVTGRVGAGKTTLLQTVLGLLPAERGTIAWHGRTVDDPARFMVPPVAAYTPQVPRLFSMALRDNLLMGTDGDDERLWAAMDTATMTRDLATMPDGLDTMVGPRGMRLSGGQVQRSAAARMLVRGAELVVFDDLSSALDVETEAALWARLFDVDEPATALVVSHRRPALARADHVVVLEAGRVVARGTAAELRRTSAAFRELWG
ncbi:ABC transporter ATP-binding protein [Salsipaludibacter albus]|uniref:ABC transporter ATP-binding protein n=1 Tax=Salsipaludibacter albus TaxID=2849650 RepID=UPI001EE3B7F3|nr:ABC transporter ATP-binding protein [Salsipaludibacter albus]MBY5162233.1 ABC transporter ATP-binding protein/permease [Salsipaludibacter albus]